MTRATFAEGMQALAAKASAVGDVIPRGAPVWLIDYPLHTNFGDVLILLGTLAMLRGRAAPIRRVTSLRGPPTERRDMAQGAVCVLLGGGNFGDLWPGHQALREGVIAANPQRRIVGLPQTLHFLDARGLDRFAEVAAGHPDLHLFWRDRRSYDVASARFPANNYLAPDMSHALWPRYRRPPTADGKPLFFMREDREDAGVPAALEAGRNRILDWAEILSPRWKAVLRLCHAIERRIGTPGGRTVLALLAGASRPEARHLADMFGRHGEIVTSRLHGHIFACLTERRSRLIDNSYGKCADYFDSWTGELGIATLETRSRPQY
jgi:pyruvyl transferase EpsO